MFRQMTDPGRAQLAQAARGVVLEIGAGGGQNFGFYDPAITERVEAIEPNEYMRQRAARAIQAARIPIHLTDAPAEALPFADSTFDSALAVYVFCSVRDPARSLAEIERVLKPGGELLLYEHVRSHNAVWGAIQSAITPVQRLVAANCHLNRPTPTYVRAAGFTITTETWSGGGTHPTVLLIAQKN